jgi:hypothetical protein
MPGYCPPIVNRYPKTNLKPGKKIERYLVSRPSWPAGEKEALVVMDIQ